MTTERYNAATRRRVGRNSGTSGAIFATRNEDPAAEILRAGDVPLSVGRIHMGHVRNYTMGDVVARYKRARASTCCTRWLGRLRVAGENAAIERKISPRAGPIRTSTL